MRYWQVALLSLFFILTDVLAHSRDSLHINNYGIADGLPDSTINAIAQDSLGFMWFGTDDGLVDCINIGKPMNIRKGLLVSI